VHHYNTVNVEAQLATRSSLLHWTRGMLALRKRHPVFGVGRYVPVDADNDAVLAFLRVIDDETTGEAPEVVLCVNNLAQTPQATTLDLAGYAGAGLEDLFGGSGFPPVNDEGRLTLSLGSRDFFWLRLSRQEADRG
jgi:maltose alpha-D-glucosyltransferase/alpha-amylase